MELVQGDIKYGPKIKDKDGKLIKTYLSSLIDDHSRYILQSEFYDNQQAGIVEDTFHKAVLRHGIFDCGYLDNGGQYITEPLQKSCGKLGIRLLHARPRNCEAKGKIEKFHQVVDGFIAEIRIAHVHSVDELNRRWKYYLEEEYQKESHDGIREYYKAMDVEIPVGGISPEQEWNRDTRELVFLDAGTVAEAFMRHETRRVDKAGCFSFAGNMYEAGTALAGAEIEIVYDPLHTDEVEVRYQGTSPIRAKRVRIGAFADKKPPVPVGMTGQVPETSRFLDALEKKSEFMKVFRELKGQVDGYNRKAAEWNEQKRQIEALNQRIVSGEMPLESAIQFMGERGHTAKTVQMKVSELPEEVSIRARIAKSRQRADEHNRSGQQRNRDRSSRGAR